MLSGRYSGLVCLLTGALAAISLHAQPETWTLTADLLAKRTFHTATLLVDGRVLVAGGGVFPGDGSATELFDPDTESWSSTGSLSTPRESLTATLLMDGRVLLAGGLGDSGLERSAELFDPTTGMTLQTGEMHTERAGHSATLLDDGRVLVIGGQDIADVELYDPGTGKWTPTTAHPFGDPGLGHTATLLEGGRVLVLGNQSPHLWDPATEQWNRVEDRGTNPTTGHTATRLPSGLVLVAGGVSRGDPPNDFDTQVYSPESDIWFFTFPLNVARYSHRAALLADGRVLIVAGFTPVGENPQKTSSVELFSPRSEKWQETDSVTRPVARFTATVLGDGRTLVAGGEEPNGSSTETAQIYDYTQLLYPPWAPTGDLRFRRTNHTATLLTDGRVLVAGCRSDDGRPIAQSELYDPDTAAGPPRVTCGSVAATTVPHFSRTAGFGWRGA